MAFTSFNFLIFLTTLIVLYYFTPIKYRWCTLLIASYFFYINIKPVYVLLTASITMSTFLFTRLIDNSKDEFRRKGFMVINVVLILLPLFFYKYFSVINNSLIALLETYNLKWPLPEVKLLLPVGISFYTFMAIGYTVDVYNEEVESEKNIGILALFISFFPLVLSGPIERAKNMLPQFKTKKTFDFDTVVKGLKLIVWGYFLKLVIADRLAIYVNVVLDNFSQHNGTSLLLASFLYPFQMYADLGGYSLLAIGTAKVLGFNVICNFNRPFFATSMSEFWRRWHISLIKWLTDYIYTPLSFYFRKRGVWGIVFALLVTFVISGIWHGPALTFIVWGLIQGLFLSIEALTNSRRAIIEKRFNLNRKVLYIILCIVMTYILFAGSLIFGRATNIHDALIIFEKILTVPGPVFINDWAHLIYSISGILFLLILEFYQEYFTKDQLPITARHWFFDILIYVFLLILILLVGVFDGGQFIYFQF